MSDFASAFRERECRAQHKGSTVIRLRPAFYIGALLAFRVPVPDQKGNIGHGVDKCCKTRGPLTPLDMAHGVVAAAVSFRTGRSSASTRWTDPSDRAASARGARLRSQLSCEKGESTQPNKVPRWPDGMDRPTNCVVAEQVEQNKEGNLYREATMTRCVLCSFMQLDIILYIYQFISFSATSY